MLTSLCLDILALLPPELALHILTLLCPPPLDYTASVGSRSTRASHTLSANAEQEAALHAILACREVSHTWRRLASDNAVWRALFLCRWGIDLRRADPDLKATSRRSLGPTWNYNWGHKSPRPASTLGRSSKSVKGKLFKAPTQTIRTPTRRESSLYCSPHRISYIKPPSAVNSLSAAPLQLDWRLIYRERLELERRWAGTSRMNFNASKSPLVGLYGDDEDVDMDMKENIKPWEPEVRRLEGHADRYETILCLSDDASIQLTDFPHSVYCVEFDSQHIVTGSRDRTMKVWSLKTGELLGSLQGAHRGSVLCLKFEKDWSLAQEMDENADSSEQASKGILVSGSSDCTICVWDMELGRTLPNGEREIKGEVKAILEGHEGGVLDIRMDDKWIVSWSVVLSMLRVALR